MRKISSFLVPQRLRKCQCQSHIGKIKLQMFISTIASAVDELPWRSRRWLREMDLSLYEDSLPAYDLALPYLPTPSISLYSHS